MNDKFVTIAMDLVSNSSGSIVGSRILAMNLSDLETSASNCPGGPAVQYQPFTGLNDPNTGTIVCVALPDDPIPVCEQTNVNDQPSSSIVPVISFEGGNPAYFVDSYPGGGCDVTVWTLTGTSISNDSLSGSQVATQCYDPPPLAPQAGSSLKVDTGDTRVTSATEYLEQISFTLTSAYSWSNSCSNAAIVEWFILNAQNSSSVKMQKGFGSNCAYDFFPAIQILDNDNFVVAYSESSTTTDPGLYVLGYTYQGNPQSPILLDQTNLPDTWDVAISGGTDYIRWGDYQSARLDPSNAAQAWVCGEYVLPYASNTAYGAWASLLASASA
jgi:hypothetical protein